jgi:hypothetical protein
MPLYGFYDSESGETFERMMSWNASEDFLAAYPQISRVVSAPRLVSGVGDSLKVDDGFKDVLNKIAEQNPYSPMAEQHGSKTASDIKRREIVKKHLY